MCLLVVAKFADSLSFQINTAYFIRLFYSKLFLFLVFSSLFFFLCFRFAFIFRYADECQSKNIIRWLLDDLSAVDIFLWCLCLSHAHRPVHSRRRKCNNKVVLTHKSFTHGCQFDYDFSFVSVWLASITFEWWPTMQSSHATWNSCEMVEFQRILHLFGNIMQENDNIFLYHF